MSLYEIDQELITGIFRYLEVPGSTFKLTFKKFIQDEIEKYELEDGKEYTLPKKVIDYINDCYYPRGKNIVHRCSFEPSKSVAVC